MADPSPVGAARGAFSPQIFVLFGLFKGRNTQNPGIF
jgi:hypothetical protein